MTRPSDAPPFAALPGSLAPLGYRNFALYWIGFVTSNSGKWVEQTGAVWLAYELTASPVLLGLLGVVRAVPAIVVSPVAGVLADRVDQRRLLFATQGLMMVTSLGLALLIATGRIELWQLYGQVALQSAIGAVDSTTRQALFPRLVPRAHLIEAVTLQSMAARSSGFIGPAVGGLVIAALGEAAPFVLNGVTSLMLMGGVIAMRGIVPRTTVLGSSFRAELSEGFHYMLGTPVLSGLLKMEVVFALFQMNPVMITIVGRELLGVGPEGLGGLLSADALGALIGIVFLLTLGSTKRQGQFVIVCTLGYSTALVAFALQRDYAFAFGALAVSGMFDSFATVTRNSVMQLAAPSRMRGRVMANLGTISRGASPLAQAQSGLLAGALGPPAAIAVAASALAVGASLSRLNRPLWKFSRDEALRPVAEGGDAGL
jgi:MFS family permease